MYANTREQRSVPIENRGMCFPVKYPKLLSNNQTLKVFPSEFLMLANSSVVMAMFIVLA